MMADGGTVISGGGDSHISEEAAVLELSGAPVSVIRRPFDPVAHELDSTFRLTKYADLKG